MLNSFPAFRQSGSILPDSALRYRFNDQRAEIYAPGYFGTFHLASDRAMLPEVQHMLSSFRYIVPIGTVPPPTCETHTVTVQVQPSAQSVQVGQQLIVCVTLLNLGRVALGLPQYRLRVYAPQGQPLFNPPPPHCMKVMGNQRLQVVNATQGPVQVQLTHFNALTMIDLQ